LAQGDYASMPGRTRRSEQHGFGGWRVNFLEAVTIARAVGDLAGA
jgi:hypothetical protein